MKAIIIIALTLTTLLITSCTYYQTAPASTSKFDQSWSAAIGALSDQGVHISTQNRGAGVIQGTRNGVMITINLIRQGNGGVRVEFDTSGTTQNDRTVIERVASSYNSRMGR